MIGWGILGEIAHIGSLDWISGRVRRWVVTTSVGLRLRVFARSSGFEREHLGRTADRAGPTPV